MALGEEEVELVRLAVRHVEPVEVDVLLHGRVNAAQIDDELAVDEHPDVVVPGEPEELVGPFLIDELAVNLESEVEVVIGAPPGIPQKDAIDREEPAARVVVRIELLLLRKL